MVVLIPGNSGCTEIRHSTGLRSVSFSLCIGISVCVCACVNQGLRTFHPRIFLTDNYPRIHSRMFCPPGSNITSKPNISPSRYFLWFSPFVLGLLDHFLDYSFLDFHFDVLWQKTSGFCYLHIHCSVVWLA